MSEPETYYLVLVDAEQVGGLRYATREGAVKTANHFANNPELSEAGDVIRVVECHDVYEVTATHGK